MKISVKLSEEKRFTTSDKQDGLRMMQKLAKKETCTGRSASSSPGREVSDNLCIMESVTNCSPRSSWPKGGESRHRNGDLVFWFASSGQALYREGTGVLQERMPSSFP